MTPSGKELPKADSLEPYSDQLIRIFAATSWLPHPETVAAFPKAVFPSVRARKGNKRLGIKMHVGKPIAIYDDNTTPRWAFLWSHGIKGTAHPSARTFAHVWERADDVEAYTHLANIAMVIEPLAGLTDKNGPLATYLRWHSWSVYGWKPKDSPSLEKPCNFDGIDWQYLPKIDHPRAFLLKRFLALDNQRTRAMKPIMTNAGTFKEIS